MISEDNVTLEATLAELEERRAKYRDFRDAVDEDLRRQRIQRLGEESAAIEDLIIKAASEGATLGQIKRAYGTKDHRTVADPVERRKAEIELLRAARIEAIKAPPKWFEFHVEGEVKVTREGDVALFTWAELEDGELLFTTEDRLWNDDYTIKNEAVALLDGKTTSECDEARTLTKFIRKHAAD